MPGVLLLRNLIANLNVITPSKDVLALINDYLNDWDNRLVYMAIRNEDMFKTLPLVESCAQHGHSFLMTWALNQGYVFSSRASKAAALNGHLDVLKILRKFSCSWTLKTCRNAARGGHLNVLKWAVKNGCPLNEECEIAAAEYGHLDILKWLVGKNIKFRTSLSGVLAARSENLEVLKFLREEGYPFGFCFCENAALYGQLDVLKWAKEFNCPWDQQTCAAAAEGGHLNILMWLRENGCPWNADTCAAAAEGGHLDLLKWARSKGCPWNSETIFNAAYFGHLEMLKWAHENGCEWPRKPRTIHHHVNEWMKDNYDLKK